MRTRKPSAALLAAILTLGLGGAACGDDSGNTTTGEGNLRDSGEQNPASEGGDTGDATEDDSAPSGGAGTGAGTDGGAGAGGGTGGGAPAGP